MSKPQVVEALLHTYPENRGRCGFCNKSEGGYAKQDKNGIWKAACWNCVKPEEVLTPQKRKQVGSIVVEDLDAENNPTSSAKSAGIAPSTHRPKVN